MGHERDAADRGEAETQQEVQSLRNALADAESIVHRLENDMSECYRREEAWRADLAERVHEAYLQDKAARKYSAGGFGGCSPYRSSRLNQKIDLSLTVREPDGTDVFRMSNA